MPLPAASDFTGAGVAEAQFKTAITDLRNYIADMQLLPVGTLIYIKQTSAPSGFLKANGAAVLRSAYSALDAAIYCGDANNATATSCYRCTDPANPSNTRSTTGAYIVLPDERGEFPRGWDDGRGIDAARSLWSNQADQNKSHSHTTDSQGSHAHTLRMIQGGSSGATALNTVTTSDNSSIGNVSGWVNSAGAHTHTAAAEGGTEARPRNNAWLACIKF